MKYRCSICNRVSSGDIQTNLGDLAPGQFCSDPKDKSQYICMDCNGSIENVKVDYYAKDNEHWINLDQFFSSNDNSNETLDDRYSQIRRLYEENGEEY